MDALLPSEVARLVLGYLQEQKCEEAAKLFMETSPLLQECRIVAQRGGKYSTKVGGLNLVDILDKYCTANAMVQEKLSKALDCEQLKHCNDLIEQLRYLLEGSRGHRFVVNISVPSQNSPSGSYGSPNSSGSSRKRHHSNSERGKRASKSLNNLLKKPTQSSTSQSFNTVEATPLESLPGHTVSTKQTETENYANILKDQFASKTNITTNALKENKLDFPVANNAHLEDLNLVVSNSNNINTNYKDQWTETVYKNDLEKSKNKCSAGTSTEELMCYCSAEVQTGPYELLESESDINDEPIENLSILTKELLQRTELHERIAENINKAIQPVESSFREENTCENAAEANLSLLTDFDNAIKSVVQATEADPIFEGFLQELFTVAETDASPDEDSDAKQNQLYPQTDEPMAVDDNGGLIDSNENMTHGQVSNRSEIPLKQRLRSSSKSQTANVDEEEKDSNTLLENQNAEAIASIASIVIASKRNSLISNELSTKENVTEVLPENTIVNELVSHANTELEKNNDDIKTVKSISEKGSAKKAKTVKPKQNSETGNNEPEVTLISEQDIMTMPTLILCSEKEVESMIQPPPPPKRMKSGFLPIAPKPEEPEPAGTIYLRTVNVPRHLVNPTQVETSKKTLNPKLLQKATALQQPKPSSQTSSDTVVPIIVPDKGRTIPIGPTITVVPTATNESTTITLYGGENDSCYSSEVKVASMPVISIDESAVGLTSSSGLSPFFKGNSIEQSKQESKKELQLPSQQAEPATNKVEINVKVNADKPTTELPVEEVTSTKEKVERKENNQENTQSQNISIGDALISKRTPRSLLKSRAANNRLSLSTPRRRNSHVRALDFNTPVKLGGGVKKMPQSCTKICRASLFKSPPFSGATDTITTTNSVNFTTTQNVQAIKKIKTLSPIEESPTYRRVPIATRSPAPKLQGNWNRVAGIGLILGETSASESSPEKTVDCPAPLPPPVSQVVEKVVKKEIRVEKVVGKKSWDSDLRKITGIRTEEQEEKLRPRIAKKRKNTGGKNETTASCSKLKKKEKNISEEKNTNKNDNSNKTESSETSRENVQTAEPSNEKNIEISPTIIVKKTIIQNPNKNAKSSKENDPKAARSLKTSPESLGVMSRLPEMLDFKTPHKTEVTIYLPPTPQVHLTPSDFLMKSYSERPQPDILTCIKTGVQTPDFPATPYIVLTPKIVEEEEDSKRPSPYYEPSEESLQPVKVKEVVNTEKILVQETTTTLTIQRNVVETQESKTIETTKFGIVEKNEVQEKIEEEKTSEDNSKETIEEESVDDTNVSINTVSDSDNESDSDSNSSTSSSSSSSNSSSSSSSSSSIPGSSPVKSGSLSQSQNNSTTESEIESPEKMLQNFSKISQEDIDRVEREERSPNKVFPIVNNAADEVPKETPAKDENVIVEGNISETPSVSEAERALRHDSLTNLSSKISAIITISQSDQSVKAALTVEEVQKPEEISAANKIPPSNASKPKIISIQRIVPAEGMSLEVSKMLQSEIQKNSNTMMHQLHPPAVDNANLCRQLEEKRQRVLAKFKEASHPKPVGQPKKVAATKRNVETAKVDSMTTNNVKSKYMQQQQVQINQKKQNIKVEKAVREAEKKLTKSGTSEMEDKKSEEDPKEVKKGKGKVNPKKKIVENDQQSRTETNSAEVASKKVEKESLQNAAKEVTMTTGPVVAESAKGISKAKVDQVKRDLFSEEEIDQRTTRSQAARRSIDSQKNDENRDTNVSQESSKNTLPGVLECLQLIPANKSENESHDLSNKSLSSDAYGLSTSQTNVLDVSFTYDDSVPIKKRKLTACEEIFKMAPRNIKKAQSPKKSPVKRKKSKSSDKGNEEPLATSSPVKDPNAKSKKSHSGEKVKKTCKKKLKAAKNNAQVENKPKLDPRTLKLKTIKIDEFLKSIVHVSH